MIKVQNLLLGLLVLILGFLFNPSLSQAQQPHCRTTRCYCQNVAAVCAQDGTDYCQGDDLWRCSAFPAAKANPASFCQPKNADSDPNDGCVRNCIVIPNSANCFRGQPAPSGSFHDIFGVIKTPAELFNLVRAGGNSGAGAISVFLTNLLIVFYVFGGIIFIFMIVWGALQWITSGGNKEAVDNARKRITHAIIGITILALAFVIIQLVGNLTGFKFFAGQSNP